jgi:hypothetical protein
MFVYLAVLANKDSLFIINGLNSVSTVADTPIVLNISNPASISYVEKYTDPNMLLSINNGTQAAEEKDKSNGLSTGAIAGIAVGAAVVVSFIYTFHQ